MEYADIVMAAIGAAAVAWVADLLGGKRGLGGALLISAIGAACGWFLTVRVFAMATMEDWSWVLWSLIGSVIASLAYFLLRNKR